MADFKKVVSNNSKGDFFVDTTCINCDTCRQLAPNTFEDNGDYSYVYNQPDSEEDILSATRALLSCPTGSIGNLGKNLAKDVIGEFPLSIEDNVYYCGFNSPKSFGGNSFFVQDPDGNWLIDSPKFNKNLVEKFAEMGGIKYIFLTHEDDVAEAKQFAEHFSAQRIIHKEALSAQPGSEIVIEGNSDRVFSEKFTIITTPGHTEGHMVLLYKNKFLFTGDHLYFSRKTRRMNAHNRHCWYSWEEQIKSMEKLLGYEFEWVLAGHGDRGKVEKDQVQKQLKSLVSKMKSLT